ncbi:MAG: hypothetical protein AB1393_07605 [Candidatus Edwardsbacteria bacterium]
MPDGTSDVYEHRLKEMVENIPGALSASLTGTDGIGIAIYNIDPTLDPTVADAEFATMLTTANRAANNLNVGDVQEIIFITEKIMMILKTVGRDYYIGVGLQPSVGNLGMARLQMKKVIEEFSKSLYV